MTTEQKNQATQAAGNSNGTQDQTPELSSHGDKSAAPTKNNQSTKNVKEGKAMTDNNNNKAAGQKATQAQTQKSATAEKVVSLNFTARSDRADSKKKAGANDDWRKYLPQTDAKADEPKPYNKLLVQQLGAALAQQSGEGEAAGALDASEIVKQLGELTATTIVAASEQAVAPAETQAAEAEQPGDEAASPAEAPTAEAVQAEPRDEAAEAECAALALGQAVKAVVKSADTRKVQKDGQEVKIAVAYSVDLLGKNGTVIRKGVPALGGDFEAQLPEGSTQEFTVMNIRKDGTIIVQRDQKAIVAKAKAEQEAIAQAALAASRKEAFKRLKAGTCYRNVLVFAASKNGSQAIVRIDEKLQIDLPVKNGGYLKQGTRIDVALYPGRDGSLQALIIDKSIDEKEIADWIQSIGISSQAVTRRLEDGSTVMDFSCPRNRARKITSAAPASARKGAAISLKVTGVQVYKDKAGVSQVKVDVAEVGSTRR